MNRRIFIYTGLAGSAALLLPLSAEAKSKGANPMTAPWSTEGLKTSPVYDTVLAQVGLETVGTYQIAIICTSDQEAHIEVAFRNSADDGDIATQLLSLRRFDTKTLNFILRTTDVNQKLRIRLEGPEQIFGSVQASILATLLS